MPVIINGSTGISGTDGSAGTPAVQGTDGNTGMFFPTADTIAFAEGGVEVMRLDAGGNVGIGTSSPLSRFTVSGGYITQTDGTVRTFLGADGSGGALVGTSTNQYFRFITNDVERMRITASGDVGIGNGSPSVRLSVPAPANNVGTANTIRIVDDGAASSSTNSNSYGIGHDSATGRVSFTAGNGGFFTFFTANTERARIASAGQLLVNTTGVIGGDQAPFQVNGGSATPVALRGGSNNFFMAFWNTSSSLIGSITGSTGSSTFYNTTSDYRLKANVVPLTDASARVQALKPSRFNFIADPDRTVDGFIAHEAAEVVPEAVHGEKDAVDAEGRIQPQGIDHSKLVPLLTAALQEALTEIAALKARVAALEATP